MEQKVFQDLDRLTKLKSVKAIEELYGQGFEQDKRAGFEMRHKKHFPPDALYSSIIIDYDETVADKVEKVQIQLSPYVQIKVDTIKRRYGPLKRNDRMIVHDAPGNYYLERNKMDFGFYSNGELYEIILQHQ